MEQQALFDQIDLKMHWYEKTVSPNTSQINFEVVKQDLPDFLCPSAESRPGKYTTDYITIVDILEDDYCTYIDSPGFARTKRPLETLPGILQDTPTKVKEVRDGLSKTFMFFESAGRPNSYDRNRQIIGELQPITRGTTSVPHRDTQWADDRVYALFGNSPSGQCGLTSIMNCENYAEIFSFHSDGAIFLFGDGSADLVNEDIDVDTFVSLFTRAADDVPGSY
jgi:prepilin-type processing-associated H-X9-DG protein